MSPDPIPLSAPDINDADIAAVTAVLRTPRLSLGPAIPAFEKAVADFIGVKHAVALNSGTSALHLCVRALGLKDGDEVITSPFSFVASANCMLFERAVPVFVDIEPDTYCIDPAKIEAAITPKTKAILGVDIFGYVADWDAIREIAKRRNLMLIEDSCEAIGSARGKAKAGTFGDCATFAFYPNKQITTGEGGMLVTDRDDIAAQARAERNQGRDPEALWLDHRILGFNYRMSDINAALGASQVSRLPEFMKKRQQVVNWYAEELIDCSEDLILPVQPEGMTVSWFVYVVRLQEKHTPSDRDALMKHLRAEGVGCNNYFPPVHLQPLYRSRGHKTGDFPVTEAVSGRTLALPFSGIHSREDIRRVCAVLKQGLRHLSRL